MLSIQMIIKKNTNIIGRENLSMGLIKGLLIFFFFSSLLIGLLVAAMTGWEVFAIGLICYAVGIFFMPEDLNHFQLYLLVSF